MDDRYPETISVIEQDTVYKNETLYFVNLLDPILEKYSKKIARLIAESFKSTKHLYHLPKTEHIKALFTADCKIKAEFKIYDPFSTSRDRRTATIDNSFLVLTKKAKPVALAINYVRRQRDLLKGKPCMWTYMLAVDPKYRGKGIGSTLEAMKIINAHRQDIHFIAHCTTSYKESMDTLVFYRHIGYIVKLDPKFKEIAWCAQETEILADWAHDLNERIPLTRQVLKDYSLYLTQKLAEQKQAKLKESIAAHSAR